MKYPDDYINKVICGDCLEVMKGIPDESIDLILTSPPYFMYKEYESYVNYNEYLGILINVLNDYVRILKKGRHIIINIDDAHHTVSKDGNECFPTHAILAYNIWRNKNLRYKETIIWSKIRSAHQRGDGNNVLYGSYPYPNGIPIKNNCEYVLLAAKKGKAVYPSREVKEASKIDWSTFKEFCSSPWYISAEKKRFHPAPFPVEFASRCITLYSYKNEIVLDPFLGIGTTALACKQLNRRFIGIEINPDYCKIARERLMAIPDSLFK